MKLEGYRPYEPLNRLKQVAPDVWIVDGPEIAYGFAGLRIPCPTRMTVIRLPGNVVWLHSPTKPTQEVVDEVGMLGRVGCIVAPNTLHYSYIADWSSIFKDARVFAVPGIAKAPVPGIAELTERAPDEWSGNLNQVIVKSRSFNEACFFHIATRTLILTDLIGRFEIDRIASPTTRFMLRCAGCVHPSGTTPVDVRAGLLMRRGDVAAAVRRMIEWKPERILLAHGKWIDHDPTEALRQSFRWAGV
jgi:Domain of unknown function (DUF4336)